jgi:hypothetical protein
MIMAHKVKVQEKVEVKDKVLGGKEVKHTTKKVSGGLLTGKKKVEKTVTKKKV